MLMWTRRPAGVLERSKMFCHVVGQIFALAILASWITSALADPLTLRVVEASPRLIKPTPFIIVRLDDDGRKALAQFTAEHVGEDVEFLVAGMVLLRARLRDRISGGIITMQLGAGEIVEVANRLATEGRMEVNAVGPPRR